MLEKQLITHCSPTLAGIKSASWFSSNVKSDDEIKNAEREFKDRFSQKGLYLKRLGKKNGRTLFYVYRKQKLVRELIDKDRLNFIKNYGYDVSSLEKCLERLKMRISQSAEFPHEIGMFLGYPLEDVKGFIKNKGQNYRCSGLWKIYANESNTLRLFEKYNHCTEVYSRLYASGRSIEKLVVNS